MNLHQLSTSELSRAQFLRRVGAGGLLVCSGSVLAACGDEGAGTEPAAAGADNRYAAQVDRAYRFRDSLVKASEVLGLA
jgi:hypothetical protein